MRTSEAIANGYVCPECNKELTEDHAGRGFVRHKERKDDGTICTYGHGERDGQN